MQDRQPTKPNRYAVYDDAHNFLRYEYHERADEPTQAGDALNKANLLPDDVVAALGLTGNPQVRDALRACVPWRLLQAYTTAGSYTFAVPNGIEKLGVFIVGGGGSGALVLSSSSNYDAGACGGASGFSKALTLDVTAETQYNLVVGAGGKEVIGGSSDICSPGNAGGSSSFNGITANGGGRGACVSSADQWAVGDAGGQRACPANYYLAGAFDAINFYGGHISPSSITQGQMSTTVKYDDYNPSYCYNPFADTFCLGAGGPAALATYSSIVPLAKGGGKNPITGLGGGDGACATWSSAGIATLAQAGTEFGCGGGAVAVYRTSSYAGTIKSGAGADGAVFIYGR